MKGFEHKHNPVSGHRRRTRAQTAMDRSTRAPENPVRTRILDPPEKLTPSELRPCCTRAPGCNMTILAIVLIAFASLIVISKVGGYIGAYLRARRGEGGGDSNIHFVSLLFCALAGCVRPGISHASRFA